MAISSANSSLRAGICTSTTRPSNPYLGQMIFETDTFVMNFWNGSSWQGAVSAPSGTVDMFAGPTAPSGWLLCAGQAVSRTTYADLFAAIGTTYGTGDGSTTFNLPDLRGRIVAGKDDMGGSAASRLTSTTITSGATTLGNNGGAETHTLTSAQMPSHTHVQDSHNHTQNAHTHTQNPHNHRLVSWAIGGAGGTSGYWADTRTTYDNWDPSGNHITNTTATNQNTTATNIATTATNQNTGGSGAHNNVQPTIILNYIIKT